MTIDWLQEEIPRTGIKYYEYLRGAELTMLCAEERTKNDNEVAHMVIDKSQWVNYATVMEMIERER